MVELSLKYSQKIFTIFVRNKESQNSLVLKYKASNFIFTNKNIHTIKLILLIFKKYKNCFKNVLKSK